jgi:uncharacterized Zn-finger protein
MEPKISGIPAMKKKQYKCDICNKSFKWYSKLQAHKLVHTGEKPYRCYVCNKSFTEKGSLRKHILLHTASVKQARNPMSVICVTNPSQKKEA